MKSILTTQKRLLPVSTPITIAEKQDFVTPKIKTKTLQRLIRNKNLVMEELRGLNGQTKTIAAQAALVAAAQA